MEKETLRQMALARRRLLNDDDVRDRSLFVVSRMMALKTFANASTVLTYLSHDNEVATWPLVEALLRAGREVLAPVSLTGNRLEWNVLRSLDDLTRGRYGIYEPRTQGRPVHEPPADSICLVPGLAFTPQGERLGYGGGYYDHFLAHYRGLSVGLAYWFQILPELPQGRFDMPVNLVVTELKIHGMAARA